MVWLWPIGLLWTFWPYGPFHMWDVWSCGHCWPWPMWVRVNSSRLSPIESSNYYYKIIICFSIQIKISFSLVLLEECNVTFSLNNK